MNYVIRAVALQATETAYVVGDDIAMSEISFIQNVTGAVLNVKANGGDGTLQIPIDGYWEPFRPIHGTISMWGTGAGSIVVGG